MQRRQFLATTAAAVGAGTLPRFGFADDKKHGPGWTSPSEAMKSSPEELLYVTAIYSGTPIKKPDYIATVDVNPKSKSYSKVIHRVSMPTVGDELHHTGWNVCSSCHAHAHKVRRFLIAPGLTSANIHVIDTSDARAPKLHKTIPGSEIKKTLNLSTPHTTHCLADGQILISMLGDAKGNGPGGFLLLDEKFNIAGRWEKNSTGMKYNYDFWYQPRHNVMVSSEWAAPNTFWSGFSPKDVQAGKYGQQIHFWDWEKRSIIKSAHLGEAGLIPLEVRFLHNPDSTHGYVGAALSSCVWHFHKSGGQWKTENVIQVQAKMLKGQPLPALITDILISMDDRFLYFSNWLHGDVRQYDISNPSKPELTGRVSLGGMFKQTKLRGKRLYGGPQMLQLSLDGKRLYVTNSLLSKWDNDFYPDIAKQGSYLLQINCGGKNGGMSLNEDFFVDFGAEPAGPARAHEMRYPGGDCSSDIFV
ncbi:MAG: selenium-binding family protein [Planctomycetes bacterium]|nr:selenium-binding family protein [Planctomycetota bacterium]